MRQNVRSLLRLSKDTGNRLTEGKVQQELTYPEHPFRADLCRKVSAFPDGFRELALSGKLNLQCIHYVHLVLQLSKNNGYDILSLAWDELLGKPGLSVLERLMGSTLSAYTVLVCSERQVASPNPACLVYIHQQIERSVSSPDLDFCDHGIRGLDLLNAQSSNREGYHVMAVG